ncbi:type II toxin-antitoxin system VapC family toxin [Novosphingobium sp. G106]|uniref:type II toxin-antitoxin system VapC family toxin n=1 Tax=Novosphingobium sp. G106 TaxID=2849500 RepID=UPI001C2CD3EE|nr:type II toxin-antitoxin system VapC family toxin [Novosphingobium sp. G106]MBV1686523.1 type II toxin-antitoxin system VapC family toxin [Novosphingobium sp. G106]
MIRYLIDANSAVYAMNVGHGPLIDRLADCEIGEVAISVISYAEVAYGTYVGKPPAAEVLEAFIQAIPLVPFDEGAAREYARLPFKRARFDRLLAAHALSIGATVVTNNEADFVDVPGLKVENWTEPGC